MATAQPDGTTTVPTPGGDARVLRHGSGTKGTLVLGHGAGGGFSGPDVQAVRRALVAAGWTVLLVEQPWLVAGRKVAVRPPLLDVAWLAVMATLTDLPRPLVVGGRSAGARVACRTGLATGADAVLCLAFPLHPPGKPEKSRAPELLGAGLPTLVVQGERDPFGSGEQVLEAAREGAAPALLRVVRVPGDHALRQGAAEAAEAVLAWFAQVVEAKASPAAE